MSESMSPSIQGFVLHVGEMGSRWGLNRTLGQICGLLFVSPRPLNAEEIADALRISRSNVSMGLKELKSWRLVRPASVPGDRREYWATPDDVWDILRILAEERRRREVDPTLSMLRDALMRAPTTAEDRHAQARMAEMYELIETLSRWFDDLLGLPTPKLVRLMKLGDRLKALLDVGTRARRRKSAPDP